VRLDHLVVPHVNTAPKDNWTYGTLSAVLLVAGPTLHKTLLADQDRGMRTAAPP
jgi:hypothetical protein